MPARSSIKSGRCGDLWPVKWKLPQVEPVALAAPGVLLGRVTFRFWGRSCQRLAYRWMVKAAMDSHVPHTGQARSQLVTASFLHLWEVVLQTPVDKWPFRSE